MFFIIEYSLLNAYGETRTPSIVMNQLIRDYCNKDTIAVLKNYHIIDTTSFTWCHFNDVADFHNCKFDGLVNFEHSHFNKGLYFFDDTFRQKLLLTYLYLDSIRLIRFDNSILPDEISFAENYNIPITIDLTVANDSGLTKKHLINFYHTDVSKFKLNYKYYELDFHKGLGGANFSKEDSTELYEKLLKNYRDNGFEESYQQLDIEYQKFQWEHGGWFKRNMVWLPEWWWSFGYNKMKIFRHSICIISFFFFWTFGFLRCLNKAYPLVNLSELDKLATKPIKRCLVKGWYALVYTLSLFFGLSLKFEKFDYSKRAGVIYVFVVYTIGIVCLAYMANFVLQK